MFGIWIMGGCSCSVPQGSMNEIEQVSRDCELQTDYEMSKKDLISMISSEELYFRLESEPLNRFGDDTFPDENPPIYRGRKVKTALFLICPARDRKFFDSRARRSPRYVFFFDRNESMIGIESRDLLSAF
jgi:hypothetical protein